METSEAEGDGTTMEVDGAGGMVSNSMETNDDGFEESVDTTKADDCSPGVDSDIKDSVMQDLPATSQASPGLVCQQAIPSSEREGAQCEVWHLSEGSCTKRVLCRGEGLRSPVIGSQCTVTLELSPTVCDLDPSLVGYPVGQSGCSMQIGEGGTPISYLLDQALITMKKNETSEVCVIGLRDISGDLVFQVTLHDFVTAAVPPWRMTPLEKCAAAKTRKEEGARLVKEGNIYGAFAQFRMAARLLLSILPFTFEEDESMQASYQQLLCQCYLNLALCQMKMSSHQQVTENCTAALAIEPTNVKALYRRASANMSLGNYLLAQEDLEKGLSQEPGNRVLAQLLQTANVQVSQSQTQLADGLSKMFS